MTGHQRLALQLLDDADGMVDTHQLRLKMTIAYAGRREWNYDRAHSLLVRMERAGLVARHRTRAGTASKWTVTDLGRSRLEAHL